MNQPFDENQSAGYKDPYPDTADIVKEQTVKRINREINEEAKEKRLSIRNRITAVLCVVAIVGGFIVCKIMGWGE